MSRDDHHQHTDQSHPDQSHSDQPHPDQSTDEDLPAGGARGLSLQGVWSGKGQTGPDVDESCETGQCRASEQMGFDGLTDDAEATSNKAGDNVQSAWRKTLEREGKLKEEATSIRELVMNSSDSES